MITIEKKIKNKKVNSKGEGAASIEEVKREIINLLTKKYYGIVKIFDLYIKLKARREDVNGLTGEDFIIITSLKFIDDNLPIKNRRFWYKYKNPDFEKVFVSAGLSLIYNEIKSYRRNKNKIIYNSDRFFNNQNEINWTSDLKEYDTPISDVEYFNLNNNYSVKFELNKHYDEAISDNMNSEIRDVSFENLEFWNENTEEKLIMMIEEELSKWDELTLKVFHSILDGVRKDKELSKKFKTHIKEIRKIKKRIKRAVLKILGEKNE